MLPSQIKKIAVNWRNLCRSNKALEPFDRVVQERISRMMKRLADLLSLTSLRLGIKKEALTLPNPNPIEYYCKNKNEPWPAQSGAYIRLDYWHNMISGGSYGHTCYIAKELDSLTKGLKCIFSNGYDLLDKFEVTQILLTAKTKKNDDVSIILQGMKYNQTVYDLLNKMNPSFIYERLVLGNLSAARAANLLKIPYIVEYNGSELEIRKTFCQKDPTHDKALEAIEEWSLKQATTISVVSAEVKKSLIDRGINAEKICINPNGVDANKYSPQNEEKKTELKSKLGLYKENIVLCFVGSFGGWHGIRLLAEAIPQILSLMPEIRFLLIGDGAYKKIIDDAVLKHGLKNEVISTGTISQDKARELLGVADIFLCPHDNHMKNMKFFGSPTKLFEYMAMGGGIVASDLEQIGQVLRPAIFSQDICQAPASPEMVKDERAILCPPGDLEEFVKACVFLAQHSEIRKALGHNARKAAEKNFTWENNVKRLWQFASGNKTVSWEDQSADSQSRPHINNINYANHDAATSPNESLTNEQKEARLHAQSQWNKTPCGTVSGFETLSLEYFKEVEKNRYNLEAFIVKTFPFDKFKGKKVLEVGCGHGTDSAQFAKNGALCHVVDITDKHLELTRRNFECRGYPLEWKKCDATAIDYPDNYFDCIYSYGVIHHIPDVEKVLLEMKRVLKPGGTICLAVYNKYSAFHFFDKILVDGLHHRRLFYLGYRNLLSTIETGADGIIIKPYVKLYGRREFGHLLEKCGFTTSSLGVDGLTAQHFSNYFNKYLWPRWAKYHNKIGWYVYAIAQKTCS